MENLDCRGLACPGPVIQVKKVLEMSHPGESFSIELDSEASKDNVRRFAESRGAAVQAEDETGGTIRLVITVPVTPETHAPTHARTESLPPVVLITTETIGDGDDKLGRILMEGFITTLQEQDRIPDQILFMNTGVRLAVEGSVVLDALRKLIDLGSDILVCGTCLDFFDLKYELAVGTVSNMYDIQGALLKASSVIRV